MARLTLRLNRLERRTGAVGPCPACKGAGRDGFVCRFSTEPEQPPFGGCPACGKLRTVCTKVVVVDDGFDASVCFGPPIPPPPR